MAKFGSDVTSMSPVDRHIGKYDLSGVQDNSSAIVAQTVGEAAKAGGELYKGSILNKISLEDQANVQEYMDRSHPQELQIEAAGLSKGIDNIWGNLDATIEDVNPVEKEFQSRVSRLKTAVEQGVMSPEEFTNRTLSTLRNAVNRNPGMIKELADHANSILELTGITGIVNQDIADRNKIANAKHKDEEFILDIAKKANTPLMYNPDGTIDYAGMNKVNTAWQGEKALLDSADRQNQFTEEHFRTFGTQYATAKINEVSDLAINILKDTTMPLDKAMVQVNLALDSAEKGFTSDPRVGKIIDKPSVAAASTYLRNQISAIKTNLKSFATKEDAAAYFKNSTNIIRDQQYQDMSKVVNPQMLDMLSKLTANVGVADFISKQPELKVEVYNGITRILDGLPTNSAVMYGGNSKSPINTIISALSKDAGKPDNPNANIALSNTFRTVDSDITKLPIGDKFNFYSNYTKTLGNPSNKEGLAKLDDDARAKATNHVNDYANITLTNMKEVLDKSVTANDKVVFNVLPDGRLTVTSSNPSIINELNTKFIPRINDSILAISNLSGHTATKEAAKEFYNTHKQFFIGGK
jgi:hypothetical protein